MATALATTPRNQDSTTEHPPLRPQEKVAVILSLLEPNQARDLADRLDQETLPQVITAYEHLRTVPKPVLFQVIANFITELRSKSPRVYGGSKRAAELAEMILDSSINADDAALALTDDSDESGQNDDSPQAVWDHLSAMDPKSLSKLMAKERPSVIAAILSRLPETIGGPVMGAMPEDIAVAVTSQMAKAGPVSASTLDAITETLRLQSMGGGEAEDDSADWDPLPRLSAILNRCPASRQLAVLIPLREDDPEQAAAVEARLIRFETLGNMLPRNAAPIIFREIEEGILYTALRFGSQGATEAVEYLYANISQRLAQQIRERVDLMAMPDTEAGETAQASVISLILAWAEEGRFVLNLDEPKESKA